MAGPDIALALVPQIPAASGDSGGAVDGVRQPAVSPAVEGYLAGSTVLPELTTSGAAELEPLMERALERASETSTGTRLGPGDPIRWHAEWTEQGLRVWIGADAGVGPALDTLVAILIDEVRRHAEARGSRLLSFVCNGRTVDSAVPGSVPSLERSPTTIVSPTCSISPAVNVRPSEEP